MILDFIDSVIDYINQPLVVYDPIEVGGLDIKETGVALKVIPSGNGERYFQGRTDLVNFQVLTKFPSQREAANKISQIAEKLTQVGKGQIPVNSGAFLILHCDVYTAPNEVEKTAKNEYIWTALFTAEIEKIGGL